MTVATYPSFASVLTPTMTQADKLAAHATWLAGLNALAAATYAPPVVLTAAQQRAAEAQYGREARRSHLKAECRRRAG